ncbi:MAG: hypothetical protein IPJ13_26005 [Saprospiraceae bacterium]|nr:hypothetical protein [Saprospiraceae bacterium]
MPNGERTAATMGCPNRDGDGAGDKDDRCPDLAGTFAGCPDTDGDGLVDGGCLPDRSRTDYQQGCPELKEEVKQVLEFAIRAIN